MPYFSSGLERLEDDADEMEFKIAAGRIGMFGVGNIYLLFGSIQERIIDTDNQS